MHTLFSAYARKLHFSARAYLVRLYIYTRTGSYIYTVLIYIYIYIYIYIRCNAGMRSEGARFLDFVRSKSRQCPTPRPRPRDQEAPPVANRHIV